MKWSQTTVAETFTKQQYKKTAGREKPITAG